MFNKILLVCLISFIITKEPYEKEGSVLVLNEQSFGFAIREFKYLLILFFDPECPHCKNFMPEYGKIADNLSKENFVFAKLNSVKYEKIANNYDLEAFPTLILLKKGEKVVFEGERSPEKIENFLKENTKPKFEEIKSKKDLENLTKDNKVVLVYFGKNEKVIDELILAERKIDDVIFATCSEDKLIKENIDASQNDGIVIFKNFDDKKNVLKDKITSNNIINFCNIYSNPKVIDFNKETSSIIFTKRNPALLIFSPKNEEQYEDKKKLLNNIWNNINDKIKLFMVDIKDPKDPMAINLALLCGINAINVTKTMIIDPRTENPKKYEMAGDINEDNIKTFINKYLKGELVPFLRSEEIPKDNNGDIFILVGNTFKKEVLDNDKDVLIYFVSPWCKVCKEFEPKLGELAKKLKKNNPKLLIAKMDGTVNDVEEYQIHNFPTTKFYPGNAKDKQPLNFHSRKNINSLLKFIKKNAFNKIVDDEEPKKSTDL